MATARQPRSKTGYNPNRRVKRKDNSKYLRPGVYTPTPGRGPYGWKTAAAPGVETNFDGPDWVFAPPDSHLEMFRLVYGLGDRDHSTLQVIFKGGGWAIYWTDDAHPVERLDLIFLMMESATHPGELIWSNLISDEWPYTTSS